MAQFGEMLRHPGNKNTLSFSSLILEKDGTVHLKTTSYSDPILQRCVDPRLFFHLFDRKIGVGEDGFPGQDVRGGVGVRIEAPGRNPIFHGRRGGEKIRITNLCFESGFVSPHQ